MQTSDSTREPIVLRVTWKPPGKPLRYLYDLRLVTYGEIPVDPAFAGRRFRSSNFAILVGIIPPDIMS
jgi:hypothetical protein